MHHSFAYEYLRVFGIRNVHGILQGTNFNQLGICTAYPDLPVYHFIWPLPGAFSIECILQGYPVYLAGTYAD